MNQQPLPQSPAYQEVVRGLLRMHQYTIDGQDDSEEADALREAMGGPWERLTSIERARVAGLSKDLYTITDPPEMPTSESMNAEAQAKLAEGFEACERGEWDRALELLRAWGKFLSAPRLAYLQATIWEGAGDRAVAAVFLEHACQLDPHNENYREMFVNVRK